MGNENGVEKASKIQVNVESIPRFTVDEIRNYLRSKDSLGDIFYHLSAENIIKANNKSEEDED